MYVPEKKRRIGDADAPIVAASPPSKKARHETTHLPPAEFVAADDDMPDVEVDFSYAPSRLGVARLQ
jgi:hypothetical protein